MVKKNAKINGGTSLATLIDEHQEPTSEEKYEVESQSDEGGLPINESVEEEDQSLLIVNQALIETALKILGKMLILLTKIDEMGFDDDEIEQLTSLWSPVLPAVSPLAGAIIGTSIIVAGKVAIYAQHKKSGKSVTESKTEQSVEKEMEQDNE